MKRSPLIIAAKRDPRLEALENLAIGAAAGLILALMFALSI